MLALTLDIKLVSNPYIARALNNIIKKNYI